MLQYFSTLNREISILISASLPVDFSKLLYTRAVHTYGIQFLQDFVAVFFLAAVTPASLTALPLACFMLEVLRRECVTCTDDRSVDG